ncbi:MAG: hypothetical protein M3Q10_04795, partial [Chloroflexota bacterium]|nr:hypothetical protein [Chloroflexota bacterium]
MVTREREERVRAEVARLAGLDRIPDAVWARVNDDVVELDQIAAATGDDRRRMARGMAKRLREEVAYAVAAAEQLGAGTGAQRTGG